MSKTSAFGRAWKKAHSWEVGRKRCAFGTLRFDGQGVRYVFVDSEGCVNDIPTPLGEEFFKILDGLRRYVEAENRDKILLM